MEQSQMIKHIVMWKIKEGTSHGTKQEVAQKMKTKLEGLKGLIDSMIEIEVGINIEASEMAYDVVLYSTFKDQEALDTYQKHPEHQRVGKELVSQVTASRAVVDYLI